MWDIWQKKIRRLQRTQNMKHFRWWGVIRYNMIVLNPVVLIREALELIGNVHQRYHLLRLARATEIDFSRLSTVVEIGGGYGAMCASVYDRGFNGRYILYDLPEMLKLQQYHLKARGLSGKEILYTSDSDDIQPGNGDALLIAMWSLSEIPLAQRGVIAAQFKDFRYWLFGFQGRFDGVDNVRYFNRLSERMGGDWNTTRIPHLGKENYYLISSRGATCW